MDGWMNEWMNGRMDGWMGGRLLTAPPPLSVCAGVADSAPTHGTGRDNSATLRPLAAASAEVMDASAAPTCATGNTAAPHHDSGPAFLFPGTSHLNNADDTKDPIIALAAPPPNEHPKDGSGR